MPWYIFYMKIVYLGYFDMVIFFMHAGYQDQSLPIEDFPISVYLTAGLYLEDDNKVLTCGGFTCEDRAQQLGCRTIPGEHEAKRCKIPT